MAEWNSDFYIGDIYEPAVIRKPWEIDATDRPYLRHIKSLCKGWPHLRHLADWMEVTTDPKRWKRLTEQTRKQRASVTRVAELTFQKPSASWTRKDIHTIADLRNTLNASDLDDNRHQFRLFVLEDLSRDMVEEFGARYDIDPNFWRYHINDYRWYNSADAWVELDELPHISRAKDFWNLRYVHPRQFKTAESLLRAKKEASAMNVLRRLDQDLGHGSPYFSLSHDGPINSMVCFCRRKVSLWLQPQVGEQKGSVAIVVVDPPFKEGYALWSGYRHFKPTPSMNDNSYNSPPQNSMFEEVIHWTIGHVADHPKSLQTYPKGLAAPILQIVAAEWLTVLQYCITRLNQVELDLQQTNIGNTTSGLETSLKRVYHWRRALPVYLKWVNDTLRTILCENPDCQADPDHQQPLLKLRDDFLMIQGDLEVMETRLQNQIMSMVSAVSAITSLQENQRAMEQNRNIARLTYLAVVFVPMAFVSSFLSMTPHVEELTETFKLYFVISLPLTVVALSVAQWSYFKSWLTRLTRRQGDR